MRIAIQAADLDYNRIDGTRVYILNLLRRFGALSPEDEFIIYHKEDFNPELAPPDFPNYKIKKIKSPLFWTQTRFAYELIKDKPDVLWMPMHNIPIITKILKNKKTKITVTIHDLAFKIFPGHFPKRDLLKLNFLTNLAVKNADKIIAVSESSKKDILKFYPSVAPEKIRVIHHGFDSDLFQKEISSDKITKQLTAYLPRRQAGNLQPKNYILYVGALQPRKNLETLIESFNLIKKNNPEIKLVLAGGKAWMWESVFKKAEKSPYSKDIIITGTIPFEDIVILYRNASLFVFPSLYEGFGIPVLEAMAAGAPVICSRNSSLPEAGGEAVLYFNAHNAEELAGKIDSILSDKKLGDDLIAKGWEQIKKFSWDKCARETLEWIRE